MAFVLLRPEHSSKWKDNHDSFAAELIRHGRTLLPGFACPEWVQVVNELPVGHKIHVLVRMLMKPIENIYWEDPQDQPSQDRC